jgi:uncharacterized protein YciI/uncharacterized protein YndB with AHSA1/START domain
MTELTPIRREVLVDADADVAFSFFTERIGAWWPVAQLSVYGAEASVAFRDGVIVESAPGRPDTVWGTVTQWQPPSSLSFTWHPGADPARASQVSVTFTQHGQQTLVRLEHAGWETFTDPGAARAEYDHGWPEVLQSFGRTLEERVVRPDTEGACTWVALVHRPGPAAPPVEKLFDDPRFGQHVAFLQRMQDAGYLVAAGPLGDEPGAGMTILRLPGTDRLREATELACSDDASVAGGFFDVTIRPWNVVLDA